MTVYTKLLTPSVGVLTHAQPSSYPTKPIRLIIPLSPGGSTDIMARLLGANLQTKLGQQIVFDNVTGRGGVAGTGTAAKAPGDGYTLLWGNVAPTSILPNLYPDVGYNPVTDFSPVSITALTPHVVLVNATTPVQSISQLIASAKSGAGKLSYGSGGTGTLSHLAGVLFGAVARLDVLHVNYGTTPKAAAALASGEVQMTFTGIPPALSQIKTGKVKALAVTTAKRVSLMPEIPTVAESGLKDYEFGSWNGVLAPASTPAEIITRLNKELVTLLTQEDLQAKITQMGFEPVGSSPEEFLEQIKADLLRWKSVVEKARMKLE